MSFQSFRTWMYGIVGIIFTTLFTTGCNTELSRARKLSGNKDYQTAVLYYEKALKRDPEHIDALKETAAIYCDHLKQMSHCYEKAMVLYKRFPQDSTIRTWYKNSLFIYARNLYIQQLLEKASEYFRIYLDLDKGNGTVYYMLADAKFRLNQQPPRKDDILAEAIKDFYGSIEKTKPTDTVPSTFDSSKKYVVQWEAYMKIARIYELWILDKYEAWQKKVEQDKKAKEEAQSKQDKKKKKKKKSDDEEAEEPKFTVNEEHFAGAIKAYKAAVKVDQPDKYKRSLPYIQMALFYARFKKENLASIKWLKEAEKEDDTNLSIAANMKMIYDRLKEEAEKKKDKKMTAEYERLSVQYDSKVASLRGEK